MRLPPTQFEKVPPDQVTACTNCGIAHMGDGSIAHTFVAMKRVPEQDEESFVPPGMIETILPEPTRTLVHHRPYAGRTLTVWPAQQIYCNTCLAGAARLIDFEDRMIMRDELERQQREIADLRSELTAREARIGELEDAVRALRQQVTIASVREKPDSLASKPRRKTSTKALTPKPAGAAA